MKDKIIEYLQQLDLTQFVPYDSNNNFPNHLIKGKWTSYSFSYEEIEFGEYNINLDIEAMYFVYQDGDYKLGAIHCQGDVTNADDDIVMSEQEIQPHLNTI